MKRIITALFILFFSASAMAQTSSPVDRAIKDSKRAHNEAKADVWVVYRKPIADSNLVNASTNSPTTIKKKKHISKRKA